MAVDRVIIHHRPLLDDLTAGIRGLLPGSVMSTAVEIQVSRGFQVVCSVQFQIDRGCGPVLLLPALPQPLPCLPRIM
jgi:hypothetical protein